MFFPELQSINTSKKKWWTRWKKIEYNYGSWCYKISTVNIPKSDHSFENIEFAFVPIPSQQ